MIRRCLHAMLAMSNGVYCFPGSIDRQSLLSTDRSVGRLGEVLADERQRPRNAYTNTVALKVAGNAERECGDRVRIVLEMVVTGHSRPESGQPKTPLSGKGHAVIGADNGARQRLSCLGIRVTRRHHQLKPSIQKSSHCRQG